MERVQGPATQRGPRASSIASSGHLLELSLSSWLPEALDHTLHLQAPLEHILPWPRGAPSAVGLGSESPSPQEAQGS